VRETLPFVTVIIPTRPEQADIPAVTAVRALDYPKDRLEILVARGKQPAVQRNAALKSAQGELIYFLDDDSRADPGNLRRAIVHFQDPGVAMLGGPNLCPADAPPIEQLFAVVLGSWLAFGPSRARYDPVGVVRATNEKELILCNLMARRDALLELGGFDESLYPNEENALMDDLHKHGAKLIYDPQFFVHRRPRPTVRAFCRMLFTYGRGRAEQFRLHPTPGSVLNFVPPLLCAYVVCLAVVEAGILAKPGTAVRWIAAGPLGLYVAAVMTQTLVSIRSRGVLPSLLALPLLVASPLCYGLGFWWGLFTRLKKPNGTPKPNVSLERVSA
jgi:glycosyltransferase involved in cell wall biosynthesis